MEYTGAPTSSSLLCSIPWDIIKNYKFIGRGGNMNMEFCPVCGKPFNGITLDNETDKDIIKWLAKQKNRSVTVRQILRTAARLEEGYNREEL